jgi:hypothetical protein
MTDHSENKRSPAICDEVPGRGWKGLEDQLARAKAQRTDPLMLVEVEDALRAIRGAGRN